MDKINKEQVIEWLSALTVIELSSLIKELEEKWGVSAAAPVAAVAAPAAADAGAAAAEEKTEFNVVLADFAADKKLAIIKVVRAATEMGLKEAKELVEKKGTIKEAAPKEEAETLKKQLEEAGGKVALK